MDGSSEKLIFGGLTEERDQNNMAQRTRLNLEEIEKYFRIDEDGSIWSYKHQQYVRQTETTAWYLYTSLYPVRGMTSVHKVVAQKYLGNCPEGCEVSHKDGNRMNNHWTNLEYITHSANQLKSYREHNRQPPSGNHFPRSVEWKQMMSQTHKKPVYCTDGRSWGSVNECAAAIGKSRTAIYTFMRIGKELKGVGGMLSFCSPADTQ
jgi:hypothetical protein